MDKSYLNLLLWLAFGLVVGYILYALGVFGTAPSTQTPNPVVMNVTIPVNQTTNLSAMPDYSDQSFNITIIQSTLCPQCNSPIGTYLSAIMQTINQTNANILPINNLSSSSSMGLITQYSLTTLPAIIVTVNGSAVHLFDVAVSRGFATSPNNQTILFQDLGVPYYNLQTNSSVGMVIGVGINASNCSYCMDAGNYMMSLESQNPPVVFSSETVYAENSSQAQYLIQKYNITKLPTVLLSSDITSYPQYNTTISIYGDQGPDEWFVLRNTSFPYEDLSANDTIRGAITAELIRNSSCINCFNVSYLSDYLANAAGLTIVNTTIYEANSTQAQMLIQKYNLTMLPAMIYSPQANDYPGFEASWLAQNNTVESDGWFVFRQQNALGVPYENLSNISND